MTALNDADGGSRPLAVQSSVGLLCGTWMGSTAIRAGEVVDVELALGRSRSWAEITRAPEAGDAGPNEVPCVVAVVEQVYDDGVAALRIGEGLALLDIVGERPVHVDGARVTISTDELEFWPTGI